MEYVKKIVNDARQASYKLALLTTAEKNKALKNMAKAESISIPKLLKMFKDE